jgi:16S rRNA processing protein RimM
MAIKGQDKAADTGLILVGRIAGAFGVRGEVRLSTYTEDPMSLVAYGPLLGQDGRTVLTLTGARPVKDGLVGRCKELTVKEEVDALRGVRLYIPRDRLPEPEEDEFYLADLIGLVAFSPEGDMLGRIKAVHDFKAGDILEIEPGGGRASFLCPFTLEAVPVVDIPGRRVTLIRPNEVGEAEPSERKGAP